MKHVLIWFCNDQFTVTNICSEELKTPIDQIIIAPLQKRQKEAEESKEALEYLFDKFKSLFSKAEEESEEGFNYPLLSDETCLAIENALKNHSDNQVSLMLLGELQNGIQGTEDLLNRLNELEQTQLCNLFFKKVRQVSLITADSHEITQKKVTEIAQNVSRLLKKLNTRYSGKKTLKWFIDHPVKPLPRNNHWIGLGCAIQITENPLIDKIDTTIQFPFHDLKI